MGHFVPILGFLGIVAYHFGLLGVAGKKNRGGLGSHGHLDSQVAGNNRPLYPKVDHYWFQVAHNYEPLDISISTSISIPIYL